MRQPDGGPDRWRERGFTLIELLVVITILGIIAAIVIFAVGGLGGDSEEKAKQADARVLRTAEEAHCANFGRYAPKTRTNGVDGLVEKKLLASGKSINSIVLGREGKCGPAGEENTSFRIFDPTDTPVPGESIRVGANPRGIAVNSTTHRVYVANYGSGTVSVINGTTGAVDTIGGVPGASTIALNAASNKVYVTAVDLSGDVTAYVIKDDAVVAGPLAVPGASPAGSYLPVAVDTGSDTAYMCRTGSDRMLAIDASDAARTISLPGSGTCGSTIAVNPGNGKVYTLGPTGLVIVPPTGTGTVVPFPATDEYWSPSVAVDPVSGNAYAVGGGANPGSIMVVNESDAVISRVNDSPPPEPVRNRNAVVVNPNSGAVFVAGVVFASAMPILSRFNGTAYEQQKDIAPPGISSCPNPNPNAMAIHPGFNQIFVACGESAPAVRGGLAIVNGTGMTSKLVTLPVKGPTGTRNAYAVAVDTTDNNVYVTNDFNPGYVHVLR